jgi:hypothetical protein
MENNKVMMLKPGIIELHVGSGIIRELQKLINYISTCSNITNADMKEYAELFKSGTTPEQLPKEWMKHLFHTSVLIKMLEDSAYSQGLTYEKEIEASSFNIEDLSNLEEN